MNKKIKSNLVKKIGFIWSRFLVIKNKKSLYLNIKGLQALLKKNGFSSSYSYILKLLKEKKIKGEKINRAWQFERKYVDRLIKENKESKLISKLFRKVFPKKEPQKKEIILPLYFGWGIKVAIDKFEEKIVTPFKNKYEFVGVFILVSIIVMGTMIFLTINTTLGVTYTWTQTDWDDGATTTYPLHPTNVTGWTKYLETTSDLTAAVSGEIEYTPVAELPAKSATLPNAKYDSATVYDPAGDKFYNIGGYYLDGSNDPQFLNEIVQYDPNTDVATTTNIGILPVTLRGHAAAFNTDDGDIYIFGGYTGSAYNLNIYKYDPGIPANAPTDTGDDISTQGRIYASVVYAEDVNKFYLFGGYYLDSVDGPFNPKYTDEIIEYNPVSGAVSVITAGSLPAISGTSAVYYPNDEQIYIFGGYDSDAVDYSDTIYEFDPTNAANGATDTGDNLPSRRAYTAASYYNSFGDGAIDKMYIFGGYRIDSPDSSIYLDDILIYTGAGNATVQTEILAGQIKGASVALDTTDGQIYFFGGYDGDVSVLEFSDVIYNYKLFFGPLVSSAYNTTDSTTVITKFEWSETLPAGTTILFQVRSASNNDSGTPGDSTDDSPNVYSDWCGPDNSGAGCATDTYFTANTGTEAIDPMFQDGVDDHWFQYRVYLVSDSLNNSPTLTETVMTYVLNTEPTVSSVTASQDSVGDVNVTYTSSDEDQSTSTNALFYDLGITLNGELDSTATTVPVSNATYLPSTGTLLIDQEEMTYTGKDGNSITGVTRGQNNSLFYKTIHTSGTTVWGKAVTVTGDVGVDLTYGSGKIITWTADTDLDGYYAATGTVIMRVTANDGNAARQLGGANSSSFEFDVNDPVVGTTSVGATGVDINGNATTTIYGADKATSTIVTLNLSATDDTTLQVIQSNDGTFDTESYESYSSSIAGDLGDECADQEYGCSKTIYVKFKDAYGNIIGNYTDTVTLDTNSPAIPGHSYIQDVSNADTSEWRLFVTWDKATESDWIRYEIASSTDGISYGTPHKITDVNLNYLLETDLVQEDTYYYKIRSIDDGVNQSDYSTVVSQVAGGNPSDTVAPTIISVATSTITTSSAKITWDTTDDVTTSVVVYSEATSVPGGSATQGVSGYSDSHEVTLTGLNASTTYYFKARSADPSNNSADSAIYSFTTETPDTTGPIISNILAGTLTEDSATITWTTEEGATSFVEHSTSTGFTTGTLQGSFDYATSHTIILHGLDEGQQYYYKVRSTDSSGNETISSQTSFSTTASSADVTGPVISSVATSSVAYNTITVTWTTDEVSSSFVEFGLNTSYGRVYGQDESVTSHSVDLPKDLLPATEYNFRVRSIDAAGNPGMSSNYTFTTSVSPNDVVAPEISSVVIGNPGTTSVKITWITDEVADSYIGYSLGTTTYTHEQGTPDMVTSHAIDVIGLQPGTTYYFRVKSKDPTGNQQIDNNSGNGYQFTTDESVGTTPVISNIQIVDVGSNTATITWITNESANSFVQYGIDENYGSTQGEYGTRTSHSVTLNGLLSDITYHFKIRSTNSSDLEGVSEDDTFTTEIAVDITPPVISAVSSGSLGLDSATITWTTNEVTDNIVLYGVATSSLTNVAGNNTDSLTDHSIDLSGLSSGVTYYYQVQSKDTVGNVTTDNNSSSYYSFVTTADTTAPTISSVAHPVVDRNSATITWTTDESATSQVEYGTDSALAGSSSTTEVTDLRTAHSVICIRINFRNSVLLQSSL